MKHPLIIGYHLIWTAYGCWLPNDPRGSGSKHVACDIIADLGELHHGRKQALQPTSKTVREFYDKAESVLKFPLLTFDERAREAIADAFAKVVENCQYTVYACAIMPDHVHLVMRKHRHTAEEMVDHLRKTSRLRLDEIKLRDGVHPTWTGGHAWTVFLDHPKDIRRTIPYVEKNPEKIGLSKQSWPFVKVYDNWPLQDGHSPNSPYAKRLRELGLYTL